MYPRNAASPPRIAVGPVVQISDGAVQTVGVSVVVRPEGGAEGAGGGTLAVGATSGIWYYTPTQAETDYTAFAVCVYKASCIPAAVTVVTTAIAVAGQVNVGAVAGTTQTAGDIIGDTNDIQSRLPAALVGGKMDSHVNDIAAGAVTAAAIATDAIDGDAIAASAVTEIQAGLATAAALTTVDGKLPAALVGGKMDSHVNDIAAGAVTAAAIATDAIDGDAIAASAVTEIQAGLATAAALTTVDTNVDAILDDTGTTGVVIPQAQADKVWGTAARALTDKTGFALGAGGIGAGAIASGAITADSLAADAIGASEFAQGAADKVWGTTARTLTSGVIKKNAAFSNIEFLMVDSADHVTPKAGLAPAGTRSIDGGAFGAVSGAIAAIGNGIYQFDALAADLNGDTITFRFTAAGADDTFLTIVTSA